MGKKKHTVSDKAGQDEASSYSYTPAAIIGRMTGAQDWKNDFPKVNRDGKGDKQGVGLADIREKYKKAPKK